MKLIKKSKKLNNVLYDIRGPIVDRAKEMEAQGQQLIKLNIGNLASFDFQVPEEIQRDMILNLPNSAGYSDSKGIFAARKAVMHYTQELGIRGVTLDDIYLGNGASDLISLATNALLDEGDELLIPMPDYPLWTATTSLSGGTPVHYLCDEENGWQPDLDDIRAKITPRTRGIVIINPNNPTGAVYPKETLLKLVDIAREFGLIIFADEVYDKILYEDAKHIAIASLSTDVLTITFNSLSKAYRACGYRAGWMIISGNKLPARDFIEGLNMLANMKLCANVPGQWAIQTALGGYQSINDLVCEGGRIAGVCSALPAQYAALPLLAATLATAKEMGYDRVIAVHQPFTYSRTKMLMDDFAKVLRAADQVVLLPIMGGREKDDGSVRSEDLAAKLPGSVVVDGLEGAAAWVRQNAKKGDLVVCMSCGDLYKAADMMVEK